MASAIWRTISGLSPVICCDVVWGISSPSTQIRIRSPYVGYRSLPLLLLRSASCHGQFLEITFGVLCTGRRDLVRPFAVETARNATARIDALDGLGVIRKDAFGLGTLVVVWRGPTRWEGRGFWLSRNWGSHFQSYARGDVGTDVRTKYHVGFVRVGKRVCLGKRRCRA